MLNINKCYFLKAFFFRQYRTTTDGGPFYEETTDNTSIKNRKKYVVAFSSAVHRKKISSCSFPKCCVTTLNSPNFALRVTALTFRDFKDKDIM